MIGPQEWIILLGGLIVLYILKKIFFGGKKKSVTPSQQTTQQQSQQQSTSVNAPININIENVVKESTETTGEKAESFGTCPKCNGNISELTHYKLKAGDSAKCEFCGEMILPK